MTRNVTLEDAKARYPDAQVFTFGDNAALCARLLALVRSGAKRATCDAHRAYTAKDIPLPVVDGISVALNWDGTPALVIRTTEVRIVRFQDVDEGFALEEGENASLEEWRASHRRYFERTSGFAPDMELVCERFRLVEDFG